MSSQGPAGITGSTYGTIRDAQDWTRLLKEKRQYYSYSTKTTGNKDTGPAWMKFGNDFKLIYDHGKQGCTGSGGNIFGGENSKVGGP